MKPMAISCDRILVEGTTEKDILSNLGFNKGNVELNLERKR